MNRELFLKKVVAAIAILVTVVSCRGELAEEGWVGEGSTRAASSALSGDLDTSFGVGGKVQTVFPQQVPNTSVVQALVRQPDGKILAGGKSGLAGIVIPAPFSVFAIARYNTDGSLDTSFGTGGRVTTGWGTNMAHVRSLALQPDGKILAGGLNANDFVANYILSRYLPNGAPRAVEAPSRAITRTALSTRPTARVARSRARSPRASTSSTASSSTTESSS